MSAPEVPCGNPKCGHAYHLGPCMATVDAGLVTGHGFTRCPCTASPEGQRGSGSNYIADRVEAPEWVCFANGRTVALAHGNGRPYLVVGWEEEGEQRLRRMAAAEDDAGCINIGDPVGEAPPKRPRIWVQWIGTERYNTSTFGKVEAHFDLLEEQLMVTQSALAQHATLLAEAQEKIAHLQGRLAEVNGHLAAKCEELAEERHTFEALPIAAQDETGD